MMTAQQYYDAKAKQLEPPQSKNIFPTTREAERAILLQEWQRMDMLRYVDARAPKNVLASKR